MVGISVVVKETKGLHSVAQRDMFEDLLTLTGEEYVRLVRSMWPQGQSLTGRRWKQTRDGRIPLQGSMLAAASSPKRSGKEYRVHFPQQASFLQTGAYIRPKSKKALRFGNYFSTHSRIPARPFVPKGFPARLKNAIKPKVKPIIERALGK